MHSQSPLNSLHWLPGFCSNLASCSQELSEVLERDTGAFNSIISKALQAQRAYEAAKKARELVRRKSTLVKSMLPGKLADCSSTDLSRSEIFIVEGDSAGQKFGP